MVTSGDERTEIMSLLKLSQARRSFINGDSEICALDRIDLTVEAGEFVAIMGQSGSGKSTLMNIIGCLDQLTDGKYEIAGKSVAQLNADQLAQLRRETFGFVFQRYNLLANETAAENVEIPAIYAGIQRTQRIERAHKLLARLGLGDRLHHQPSQLSGGQQQRVAIARALMNDAPVILADEPTGALDSKSGVEVMDLLHELHATGKTIVLITHDETVARHAQRIVRLKDGKILDDIQYKQQTTSKDPQRKIIQRGHIGLNESAHEATRMALNSLHTNGFRTALTLLGIIIGVASVVTMLAVGSGSKQKVLDQINAMGTHLLMVLPGAPGIRPTGDQVTLTADDAIQIHQLPNVQTAVPGRNGRMTVRYGEIDTPTTIQGTGADFPEAKDWPIEKGQFFSAQDVFSDAPVALLGQTILKTLFPHQENPLGKFILIKDVPFQIIGIMSEKGASFSGNDQDDAVFIPYSTGIARLFGKPYLSNITVKVDDVDQIDNTEETLHNFLVERHHIEDFTIRNMASLLETATETQNTLTLLLGVVAAISLIVGGIGVMNIMLVSVTERTREIGIRMATGARTRDILLQFNIESLVVCAIGGLLGVVLGLLLGLALKASGMNVIFSLGPPLVAFSCACLTGIVFGYLPARKAALLDPVVALAAE